MRKSLQEQYLKNKPSDMEKFSPAEHKRMHDKAYRDAACSGTSAFLLGWYVVDTIEMPLSDYTIPMSINLFGSCRGTAFLDLIF